MGVRINKELRDLLENEQFDISSPSAMLVRSFYRSCTNVSSMETLGLEPMKEVLKKYGGWPVVMGKEWNGTGYDWMVLNAWLMREVGQPYILAFGIAADYKNISKRILHIDQPSLGLGKRDYYVNADYSQFVDSYLRFMIDIAVQLGANETSAKSEMEEVLKFEKDLAEASARDEDRRDFNVLYNTMTIAELKGRHPKVNFSIWFDHMTKTGVKFDDSDVINLDGQPFVKKLPGLLSNYSSRVLANYQMWRLVQSFVDIFPPSQREHLRQFLEDLTGTPKFKERWEECIETLVGVMPMPVGALYVKKYFSEDSKKEADSMMNAIREAMKIAITSIDWMDRSTRNYSLHKLASMAELRDDQYFNNSLSLIASAMDRTFNELRIPINRMEWEEQIAQANAWYLPTKNKMVFPAGIFHYPLFAAYAPPYVNYGRIGSVMGHELTHGFDDTGRQFDADGNFLFWWTNETSAAFQRGAKCFIDQYSIVKDKTTGLNLNGENTQGENIADNGGVKLAYKAWCTLIRLDALKTQIITDTHSPSEYSAAGCALLAVAYRNTVYSSSPFTVHAAKVLNVPEGEKPSKFQLNFIADVVEAVAPAVVYIDAVGKLPFFGGQSVTSGSGFIVRSDGYILTNAHVVEGVRGGKLRVHLHDGTTYEGHVTYMDTTGDLALVRIHAKDLPALKLGDSSKSRPGEWVIAVGSPFSLTNSVTMGIISSVKRRGSDLGLANTVNYIQTDALITFGNSGGPLVNLDGEAIGINSMKVTDGISFAIPSDYAKSFLNQCAELEESAKERSTAWPFGKKKEDSSGLVRPGSGRRRIGITMMQLDEQTIQAIRGYDPSFPDVRQGVLVHSVVIGQPAFESGVRPGDVITHVNGRAVSTSKDLLDAVDSSAKLRLRVMRRSKILELEIIPAADASDM